VAGWRDGWLYVEPVSGPVCSCCGGQPVVALYEGPSFKTAVRLAADVRGTEVWAACSTCEALVEVDDREALVTRGVRRWRSHGAKFMVQSRYQAEAMARYANSRFWEAVPAKRRVGRSRVWASCRRGVSLSLPPFTGHMDYDVSARA